MSFFRTLQSTMNNERLLVDALKHMKYEPIVEDNQTVRGDTRSDDRKGYRVLLKKEHTQHGGDIGFKLEDGVYTIGMDPYIVRGTTPQAFLHQVEGEYVQAKARGTAKKLGLKQVGSKSIKVNGRPVTQLLYEKVGA